MSFVIAAPKQASVPVKGTHLRFPVRRIYCVGRNYNDHVVEMGGIPGREPPFSFRRPPMRCCWVKPSPTHRQAAMCIMKWNWLYVALHSRGAVTEASQHIYGYAVGIDMTRRDLQGEAKKKPAGRGRSQKPLTTRHRSAKSRQRQTLACLSAPAFHCTSMRNSAKTPIFPK
jgi:fumarylpyruvate hydrolase